MNNGGIINGITTTSTASYDKTTAQLTNFSSYKIGDKCMVKSGVSSDCTGPNFTAIHLKLRN